MYAIKGVWAIAQGEQLQCYVSESTIQQEGKICFVVGRGHRAELYYVVNPLAHE